MGLPPLFAAVHVTTAELLAGVAVTPVGADGTVYGLTALVVNESWPSALIAVTVNT